MDGNGKRSWSFWHRYVPKLELGNERNEGVVEAVKKFSPPPTPPPAGDMTGSTQIMD